MPSVGFEPAIPAIKRTQSYALLRAATAISFSLKQWRSNAKYSQDKSLKFQILMDNFWYHHHHHHHHASLLLFLFHFFHGIRILDSPAVEFILRQFLFQQIWAYLIGECIIAVYLGSKVQGKRKNAGR
jgi:hypothetical protein